MEENQTVEQEVDVAEDELSGFDAAWDSEDDYVPDSDDLSDPDADAEEQEGQPDDAEEGADEDLSEDSEEQTEEPGDKGEEGNQLFTINYLGNEEKLTLDQMKELAQKGRDYDHVREERDKLRSDHSGAEAQMEFLKELADRAGLSVEEQIDRTRALWLQIDEADNGNDISEADALQRVQRERKNKANKAETKDENGDDARLNPQIDRFLKVYPNVQATDIPKEVWDMAATLDGDLLSAYQAYEIKTLREERTQKEAAAKKKQQNEKNESRSAGSRRSAGAGKVKDDFDDGWDSEI